MFERIEKLPFEVKRLLLNNETIRKLLGNDSNNALNMDAPSTKVINHYITTYPVFEFENKEDYTQHGMINVYITTIESDHEFEANYAVLRINIVYNVDKWELINNKIRTLSISDEVVKELNGVKFSVSNTLEFDSLNELILNKQLVGYALLFKIIDGNDEIINF